MLDTVGFLPRPVLSNGSMLGVLKPSSNTWSYIRTRYTHDRPSVFYGPDTFKNVSTQSVDTGQVELSYKETIGWDNPDIKSLRRKSKLLPMTPFIQKEVTGYLTGEFRLEHIDYDPEFNNHSFSYHTDNNDFFTCEGPFLPVNFVSNHSNELMANFEDLEDEIFDVDYDSLVQAAAADIYASGFDALTSVSEFHKILDMFKGLKQRILKELKRGRLHKLWLEGRYGWRILIYEIRDLNEAITEFESQRQRYTESVHKRRSSESFYEASGHSDVTGIPNEILSTNIPQYRLKYHEVKEISTRGTVSADIDVSRFRANPVETAWELIPYSFVIDWIIDFGQWIRSVSFSLNATSMVAAGGVRISKIRNFESFDWRRYNANNLTISETFPGFLLHGQTETSYTIRQPVPSIPFLPQYKGTEPSSLQISDLIALWRGSDLRR